MEQFKLGDVVQLKSGGPLMTIREGQSGGKYVCVWFAGTERKAAVFTAPELTHYDKKGEDD